MSKKTKRGQARHDRSVLRSAKWHESRGYKVKADLPAYTKPRKIRGHFPDLIIKKGKKEIIIEVQPKKTNKRDESQHRAFRNYSKSRKNVRFRKKII